MVNKLAKPIITGSSMVFDATKAYTFSFSYSGATVYKHQIYITEKVSGSVIYNKTIESRILQCTIPAKTLSNNKTYFVQVAAIDAQGNSSELSNKVYAICQVTPTLSLDITDSQKIDTSNIEVTATFSQTSGTDSFKQCKFYLYSDNGTTVLSESPEIYPSTNMQSYKFVGLSDDATYYVRCKGQSTAGFSLDTGLIRFYVMQAHTKQFNNFYVKNQNGGIHYESNLIVISPNETSVPINSSMVNLTQDPFKLTYESGYTIPEDFSLLWIGYVGDPKNNSYLPKYRNEYFDETVLCNDNIELHLVCDQLGEDLIPDNNDDRYLYCYLKLVKSNDIIFSQKQYYCVNGWEGFIYSNIKWKILIKHYNGLWSVDFKCEDTNEENNDRNYIREFK